MKSTNHSKVLFTFAVALTVNAACGGSDNEVVSRFGALTVTGERFADQRIETMLTDASGEPRLALGFDGRTQLTITRFSGDESDTREAVFDASLIGAELEAWNQFTFDLHGVMPEAGESESASAVSSGYRTLASGEGSCMTKCLNGGSTLAQCTYYCTVINPF